MPPTRKGMAKQKYRFLFRKRAARILKRIWFNEKYCVRCGRRVRRKYSEVKTDAELIKSNDIWEKKKKCSKCSDKPKFHYLNPEEKCCNMCGNKFHEFDESTKVKDWNSWNLCAECKKLKLDMMGEIDRSLLDLADRAYKEFLTQKFFIQKKRLKKLPQKWQKIIPEVIDVLEDFFRKASASNFSEEEFNLKYRRLRIFFWRTVEEELMKILIFLREIKKKIQKREQSE